MCKYLNRRGFHAYEFGINTETGLVDIEAGDYTVVSGVSSEAGEQIIRYLAELEARVEDYIECFVGVDINDSTQPTYKELLDKIKQLES